ncbi:hypothetical protein [Shewanella sp. GutDb-MelDb]|uniref:hypothetical protein n=1 Tax=Shewanella sp. GutDb-MelDb TaxID=2058316 RepID=UPI000C7A40F6|nr:hypothetical protein [Shewanella sp. GutDb-MelDb]PKG59145.1 hypothetical protein CXF82_00770 [Shewanella sp. GutDb-MelDb]
MSEFRNRIESQREAVKIVNSFNLYNEPLFSLTEKSINRWVSVNTINPADIHVDLIYQASKKLFFLANKSQGQITDDYQLLSKEVTRLLKSINREMSELNKNYASEQSD